MASNKFSDKRTARNHLPVVFTGEIQCYLRQSARNSSRPQGCRHFRMEQNHFSRQLFIGQHRELPLVLHLEALLRWVVLNLDCWSFPRTIHGLFGCSFCRADRFHFAGVSRMSGCSQPLTALMRQRSYHSDASTEVAETEHRGQLQ
jgi:hypothetical protein